MTDQKVRARAAFVKLIREENVYSDFSKQSLKQHWSGADGGFADEFVQNRWTDFYSGWQAALNSEARQTSESEGIGE